MDELKIPKLDGNNYTAWSIRTRAALVQKNCWEAIDPGYGTNLSEDEKKNNDRALTFLFLVVEDEFLDDIADIARAKDAWTSLRDIHTKFGLLHTLQLLKEFFNVTLSPGESVAAYLRRLMELHRKVSACGYGFTDREVALVMLMGLPKEYEGLILNLERDENELSTQIVKSKLIVEEKKLRRYNSETDSEIVGEKALKTREKGKSQTSQKQYKNNERKTRCFSCGQWGHISRFCTAAKNAHAKMVSDDVYQALFVDSSGDKPSCDWYLDSGATEHMCSQEQKFMNLVPAQSKVEIANSEKIEVSGTGDIILRPTDECGKETIHLAKVLYVPKLDGNLLSVGRIEEMGLSISFQKGKAVISDPKENKIILTAYRCGRLYKVEEKQAHKVFFTKQETLMHRRLGHFHYDAIKKLMKRNESFDMSKEISEGTMCSTCILGKMKKTPFPKGEGKRASRPLELIHSDVIGPISPVSRGGSKYVVTFVDDYSRYVVIKLMKSKAQVFEKFVEYKRKVENFHGLKITTLQSDNGGEYISEEFDDFLVKNGIARQLTVPRTPQQNGVAEKMNHTLFDMTRCLLLESNIPKELWADAVTTACYLRNKCPSKAINGSIPEELWTQNPVQTDHLRVFGCKVFAQIDKTQLQGKLGKRSQECVLIGYPEGVKGYKLWNVDEDKFLVSRSVKFDETAFPLRRSQATSQTKEEELTFNMICDSDANIDINLVAPEAPVECVPTEIEKIEVPMGDVTTETEKAEPTILKNPEQLMTSTVEPSEIRRSNRERRPKTYYGDPLLYIAVNEEQSFTYHNKDPTSLKEAMNSPDAEMWREAMKEELNNLHQNQTWELVPKPPNIKPIGCKWVFKKKLNTEGEIIKFKARLVAKGYSQVPGRDFYETFSPVVKIKSLRILLALAVELGMEIHQMDITAAYLNGTLKEDVYMVQPEGSQESGEEHLVCHLKKSLYGLKQSGRQWNECLDTFLKTCGLLRSKSDPCIYYHPNKTLYLGIYVDDMLIVGTPEEITAFKQKVMHRFEARDLGEANEILSMRIQRHVDGTLTLDQTAYIEEMLETFQSSSLKGASTPMDPSVKHKKVSDEEWKDIKEKSDQIPYRQAIGSLLYLACGTRPDIAYSATCLSQFNERPSELHWRSIKHLFRYLKETKHLSLTFRKTGKAIEIYSDADWGTDQVDRKSFSGYVLLLGGAAISWSSKKQSCVALSSAEAEYMAISHVTKEVLWIKGFLKELGAENFIPKPTVIHVDNQAAMFIAMNQTTSERSKHMDIRYHFIRDCVEQNIIHLEYINSKENLADLLTKNTSKKVLIDLRKYLGFSI